MYISLILLITLFITDFFMGFDELDLLIASQSSHNNQDSLTRLSVN